MLINKLKSNINLNQKTMKRIALILMVLGCCMSSIRAQEAVTRYDTVRCETCDSLTTPQPTDNKFRVVTNKFWDNWFVLADVGGHVFLGDYGSVGKFSGLLSPELNIGVGKWFTPGIGVKLQFGISNSRGYSKEPTYYTYGGQKTADDGTPYWKSKMKWWDLSASAMFNLSRLFCGYEGKDSDKLMNQFIASVGIGALHHWGIDEQRNEWSGHLELQYSRFLSRKKNFSLDLKARATLYQTNFDGITVKSNGEDSHWFDANVGLSVGFTYYFKKRHWDRCAPCERPVYNVNKTVIMPTNECPEYGTMEFYVFFPNNYSGRNDAPTVSGAPVNAIDYLASGIFTQKKFDNAEAVASNLKSGKSLSKLNTSDIPTENITSIAKATGIDGGYEMSDTPISLSMDASNMNMFKDKTGYYYAPMYYGNNTWYYRVDRETAGQRLLGANNYKESKSFSLNAHNGLELVKNNLKPDADAELYSFADIYSAIEGNDGNIANAANTEAVNRLNEIFTKGRIIYVMAEGLATSQDNYIGEDSENVGLERNKTLAYNRAYTVVNWLKGNEKFRNVSNNVFAVNALVNPIVKVDDKSVQGLNSKLGRCVKVRIHFVIDK